MYKKMVILMKSILILNLITAHKTNDEVEFTKALEALALDEEKKGNVPLAKQLRDAYKNINSESTNIKNKFIPTSTLYSPQGAQFSIAPRDKDNLLELYEIVDPSFGFNEVVLPQAQKDVIMQIIQEQKNVEALRKHNIVPANRLLLCGPPGCGKTITAKAIATEMGLPMAYVRLDGLVSSYLGQTSTNLRKVFDAVKNQRIVLFLDEFDAIAKKRDDSHELGELKRVVTALLQNFDNMPDNVFLIAATNHHHLLDPAIWRRFNLSIILDLPDLQQRKDLIAKWLDDYSINAEIDIVLIAKLTEGLNGAQIKELVIASAKHYITNNEILKDADVIKILLQQLTMFSENKDQIWTVLKEMNDKGVGLRTLAKATGMAHTTLSYRLSNVTKEGDCNEQ